MGLTEKLGNGEKPASDQIADDFVKLVEHAMDLERTLYRLAQTILLDKIVDLDAERKLAMPSAEIPTYLGDYWTQAQLYAALTHAVELTAHICPSCEGAGGEDIQWDDAFGEPNGAWKPCLSCKGTGLTCERVTTADRQAEKAKTMFEGLGPVDGL